MSIENDASYRKEPTDAELISDFVNSKSAEAFETLVRRHYNVIHGRLLSITRNSADADDLSQKLWLRVLENLPNYKDNQKFPNFLNTVATNLVRDEWRKLSIRKQSSLDELMEESSQDGAGNLLLADEEEISEKISNRTEISHLVKVLIPKLGVKLRAVFLLRHESEYWDDKQPFQWQHLAELNNLDVDQVVARFIEVRDFLLSGTKPVTELVDDDRLIFLTWTQAQRFDKSAKQTETYLASLLGIPVNTFKTRYRAALAELSDGLERWRNQRPST